MTAVQRRTLPIPPNPFDPGPQNALAGPSTTRFLPTQPDLIAPTPTRVRARARSPSPALSEASCITSPAPAPSRPRSRAGTTPSRPPSRTERRFRCGHEGCDKAYFKPSRLAEHELTHTGERPHACPNCEQTYLRASHLTAHMRTHLPTSAREFHCEYEGCDKAFWTATHLRRHQAMHEEAVVYPCEHCSLSFHKANHLREHIAIAHLPSGTKPFQCTHEGCDASFLMRQQLKAHEKTHDASRYTCSHPSHGSDHPSFPTWSSLQTHLHTAHPPACPHAECGGKTFPNVQRLKDHLKVHALRAEEAKKLAQDKEAGAGAEEMSGAEGVRSGVGPFARRKRRRSAMSTTASTAPNECVSEEGKEEGAQMRKSARVDMEDRSIRKAYPCPGDGCDIACKTKLALRTHRRNHHPHMPLDPALLVTNNKIHTCPANGCTKAYAHKSNLQDHLASHTSTDKSNEHTTDDSPLVKLTSTSVIPIPFLYETDPRRYGCPITQIRQVENDSNASVTVPNDAPVEADQPPSHQCYARFWRVYDVRRHLKAEHGLELEDGEVRELLRTVHVPLSLSVLGTEKETEAGSINVV